MAHLLVTALLFVVCTVASAAQTASDISDAPQWRTLGSLTSARTNVGAVFIGEGRILVIGGSTGTPDLADPRSVPQRTCEIVDVWRRTISPAAPLNVPRSEFVALQAGDSSVIAIGGVTTNDPHGQVTPSIERFDRATGVWTEIGRLRTARRQHGAAFIDSHRILIVGGRSQDYNTLTDSEIFDLRTGLSTPTAAFPYPVNESKLMTSHSGEAVVLGGRKGGPDSPRRPDVFSYDPVRDEWVLSRVLEKAVTALGAVRLWDRRVIVAGGLISERPTPTPEVQLENVGKWKLISPMTRARFGAALAQWTENSVLVIGGHYDNWTPIATTEWIDMNRHRCTEGPTLATARARFAALSIHSARGAEPHHHTIVVIGGVDGAGQPTGSVEILEPIL